MISTGGLVCCQQRWRCYTGLLWWRNTWPWRQNSIYIEALTYVYDSCGCSVRDLCAFLLMVPGLTCRDKVRSSDIRTPLCQKEPAEVVQASDQDVSWLSVSRWKYSGHVQHAMSCFWAYMCFCVCMCALTHLSVKTDLRANANLKLRINNSRSG